MSTDSSWKLPLRELDRGRIETSLKKVLRGFTGAWLQDLDEDDEFAAEKRADGAGVDDTIEFNLTLPATLVAEFDDTDEGAEHDDYEAVISLSQPSEGTAATVSISSSEADNKEVWATLCEIAGKLSVALGGTAEPEAP